jgi:hypothetical protein
VNIFDREYRGATKRNRSNGFGPLGVDPESILEFNVVRFAQEGRANLRKYCREGLGGMSQIAIVVIALFESSIQELYPGPERRGSIDWGGLRGE